MVDENLLDDAGTPPTELTPLLKDGTIVGDAAMRRGWQLDLKTGPDGKTADRRQGIGLPLARQLIAAHGGTLELVSEPGQGTTATITLP